MFKDLREKSAGDLIGLNFDGYAIGGLSVGESAELMLSMVENTASLLPEEKPRYLMGVGTPENIVEAVKRGVDLFDCVLPTRNARNGMLFTSFGRIVIKNARHRNEDIPIDSRLYLLYLYSLFPGLFAPPLCCQRDFVFPVKYPA